MAKHKRWADSEIASLRKLAKTHTLREAAALLGRNYPGVESKAHELRISFRKYGEAHHSTTIPTANVLQVFELRDQGLTTLEIARRLGTCPQYVNAIARFGMRYRETLPHLLACEAVGG